MLTGGRPGVVATVAAVLLLGACHAAVKSQVVEPPLNPDQFQAPAFTTGPGVNNKPPVDVLTGSVANVEAIAFPASDGTHLFGYLFGADGKRSKGAILVHSSGSNMAMWYPVARRLMAQGYAVITLDLRGYGDSAGPRQPAAASSDVLGAISVLGFSGVQRFGVIGVELGGTAAVQAAFDREDHAVAVGVIDSQPSFQGLDASAAARAYKGRSLVISSSGFESLLRNRTDNTMDVSSTAVVSGSAADAIVSFVDGSVR